MAQAKLFWARGYHVSTAGRDEDVIRNYIKNQEHEDLRLDLLKQGTQAENTFKVLILFIRVK